MSAAVAFLIQAAATASPVTDNVQMTCTLVMPGTAPATASVDLRTKKRGIAALVADQGPLARVSSASAIAPWPAGGANAVAFAVATGNGQYRIELAFDGAPADGKAQVRLTALGDEAGVRPVGQGFCTPRKGKRLSDKKLAALPFVAQRPPARALALRPSKQVLPAGTCRVVARDRSIHRVDFTFLSVVNNEANVAYRFDDTSFGTAAGTATGVQFRLAAPNEQLYALTVALGDQPSLYVHTTFERSGNWVDLSRGGTVLGLGECGTTPEALLVPKEESPTP